MAKLILVSESASKKQQQMAQQLWGAKGKILIAQFDALRKLKKKLGQDENSLLTTIDQFLGADLDEKAVGRLKNRKGFDTLPARLKNINSALAKLMPHRTKYDEAMKGLKPFSTLFGKEAGKMTSLSATKAQVETAGVFWGKAKARVVITAFDALKKQSKKLDQDANALLNNLDQFLRGSYDQRTVDRLTKRKGFATLPTRLKALNTVVGKLLTVQDKYNEQLKGAMKFNSVLGKAVGAGVASSTKTASNTAAEKAAKKVLKDRNLDKPDPMKLAIKVARTVPGVKVVTAPNRDVVIPGMPKDKELKVGNGNYRFSLLKNGKLQLDSIIKFGFTKKVGKQIAFSEEGIRQALVSLVENAANEPAPAPASAPAPAPKQDKVEISAPTKAMDLAIKVAKSMPGVKVVVAPKRDIVIPGASRPQELKIGNDYYKFVEASGKKLQLVQISKFGHTSKSGKPVPFTEAGILTALGRLVGPSGLSSKEMTANYELAQGMTVARGIGFENGEFILEAMKAAGMKDLKSYDTARDTVSFTAKGGLEATATKFLKQLKKNIDTSSSLMHIESGKDRDKLVQIATYINGKQATVTFRNVGTGLTVSAKPEVIVSPIMFDGSKYIATPAALNLINKAKFAIPKTRSLPQTKAAVRDGKYLDTLKDNLSLGMTAANIRKALAKLEKVNLQYLLNEFPELGEI